MEAPRRPKSALRYDRYEMRRDAQWEVIRAARAFLGRPLDIDDLSKIRRAQEAAGQRGRVASPPRVGATAAVALAASAVSTSA